MARRAKRVKLSKAQQLEHDLNRALAKKDELLASLVKVMLKLKTLQRSHLRMRKTNIKKLVVETKKLQRAPKPKPTLGESCDAIVSGMIQGQTFEAASDNTKKMEALGFHKSKRRKPHEIEKQLGKLLG
jgi:hypothetical protein